MEHLPEQVKANSLIVSAQNCVPGDAKLIRQAYGSDLVHERHRHRYEFNNQYRQQFMANGMAFSGTSPDGKLVEVIELPQHPWFVAVQCHPKFKSKPTQPHPLFKGLVDASLKRSEGKKKSEAARSRAAGSVSALGS
jgi:CTP synthase